MLRDFNLLATTWRGNEREACSELSFLLGGIGDSAPEVRRTGISGLIAIRTAFNPVEAVEKLRKILHERPYEFRHTLRIIPVEKVVRTDLDEIREIAEELGLRIGEDETFRITVEKRFTTIHAEEIIEATATSIKRKVDLTNPGKILLVEVVGKLTGMSLLKPSDTLSVMKEKML
jgi:tRNA acetyltransferase TAN1